MIVLGKREIARVVRLCANTNYEEGGRPESLLLKYAKYMLQAGQGMEQILDSSGFI